MGTDLAGLYCKCQKETTDVVNTRRKDLNDPGKQGSCISQVLVVVWPVYTSLPFFMQKAGKGGMNHGLSLYFLKICRQRPVLL